MRAYVWLSFPLGLDDPRPPAIPPPTLNDLYTIENDGANVQTLHVASHTGTHVDAPLHVCADGLNILDFTPADLTFTRPVIIDMPVGDCAVVRPEQLEPWRDALSSADIALFRFGWKTIRERDPRRFSLRAPGFGVEAASWLVSACPGLRAIGMDVPSLACIAHLDETMAAHNELLCGRDRRFLVVEDMDLDKDLSALLEVRVSPWLVRGMDSGPCSVIGILDQGGED